MPTPVLYSDMDANQPPHDIDDSAFAPVGTPGQTPQPTAVPPQPGASPFQSMPAAHAAPAPSQSLAPTPPGSTAANTTPNVVQPTTPAQSLATPIADIAPAPTATASGQTLQHLPADVAEKIAETPQLNSQDVESKADQNKRTHRLKNIVSTLIFIGCIIVAAFLINQFIFQSYFVDGTSMTPTLQNNDRLIIDKTARTWAHLQGKQYMPARGQIVVLDSSIVGVNGQNEQLIKRVIGLPGDTIHIENGVVTVKNTQHPDGFDVDKSLGLTSLAQTYSDGIQEFSVGANQVFVMGDNRTQNGSYDSRAFGPVDAKNLEGRLWARILPLNSAKIFNTASTLLWNMNLTPNQRRFL